MSSGKPIHYQPIQAPAQSNPQEVPHTFYDADWTAQYQPSHHRILKRCQAPYGKVYYPIRRTDAICTSIL